MLVRMKRRRHTAVLTEVDYGTVDPAVLLDMHNRYSLLPASSLGDSATAGRRTKKLLNAEGLCLARVEMYSDECTLVSLDELGKPMGEGRLPVGRVFHDCQRFRRLIQYNPKQRNSKAHARFEWFMQRETFTFAEVRLEAGNEADRDVRYGLESGFFVLFR